MAGIKVSQCTDLTHLPIYNRLILVTGQTDSGKTTLVYDTISRMMRASPPAFAKIVVLSPTGRLQSKFWGTLPVQDVMTDPEEYSGFLEWLINFQEQIPEAVRQHILLIVDDCVGVLEGKQAVSFKRTMKQMATSGRHVNISIIVLTQDIKDSLISNPTIRVQASCIVSSIIGNTHREELEGMLGFENKKIARMMTTQAWEEPYRFICYDQSTKGGGDVPRHSFVKCNIDTIQKFGIKYK